MADLMNDLQVALTDLNAKKKVFDDATSAVIEASYDYEASKTKVVQLRLDVDKELDNQLINAGISPTDSRVHQSE
jgi:hypothetical protein